MRDELKTIEDRALSELRAVGSEAGLEEWRVRYLGRRGELSLALRGLGALPPEERPAVGQVANEVKQRLEAAYDGRRSALEQEAVARAFEAERVDVTLPGRIPALGRLHISTQTLREIYAIFAQMGFTIYEAPEVETDELNFQLLNIPPHHPARDMWSTLYTERDGVLLRTHTSPGQIRIMRELCPGPIRAILPGKVYRYEQVSARYEFMLHQVEGLVVGRNIHMSDLKGVLEAFARQMFAGMRRWRFRGSYFPFTEPSMEMDIECVICSGPGCPVCKYSGWVEILGSGMVHPAVLENGGYDPAVYSGFAFGMGPERIAMLKHRINDIRYFFSNDPRFLAQFG
ncbi:MAG: phenylalanine--tRNA ligase subunit alpha [Anaerolineae bacterium]|nr:phenylalanine--tRNA ligase subunit alpha [Anaerolineae bacterium]